MEELIYRLRNEIALLRYTPEGCSCCPDWDRVRQEARAQLAEDLLDLLEEKYTDD